MRLVRSLSVFVLLLLGLVIPAHATFITIAEPGAVYQAFTTKIPIMVSDWTFVSSLADPYLGISLSTPMLAMTVGAPDQWATWSSPPYSEESTPRVLFSGYLDGGQWVFMDTVSLTFNQVVHTFGVEMQPNSQTELVMQADFYEGVSLLGSITLPVDGYAGARLFAATTATDHQFTKVTLSILPSESGLEAGGFAIAQVRYANDPYPTIPEPGTLLLLGSGLAGLAGYARFRRKKR